MKRIPNTAHTHWHVSNELKGMKISTRAFKEKKIARKEFEKASKIADRPYGWVLALTRCELNKKVCGAR